MMIIMISVDGDNDDHGVDGDNRYHGDHPNHDDDDDDRQAVQQAAAIHRERRRTWRRSGISSLLPRQRSHCH